MLQGQPDELDAFMDLGAEDVARLVLCLLVEEMLRERLDSFRGAASRGDLHPPRALHAPSGPDPSSRPLSHSSASKNSASLGFT